MVRPPAQAPAAERHEAVGVLRPSGLAAPLPVRVSLRPLPCCEGWQEWPAGRAPGKHKKQGQGRQEPGEEGAQEGPKHPRPARPRSPPGSCCPSTSRPRCPSGFHQCPPDPPARCPPRSPRPAIPPNLHHPALHHAAPLAPVQIVAPAFIHHPAPLPIAPLPIAPVQQVQVAAPAPALPEDAPAVIAVGRAAEPAPAPKEVETPVTLYGAPAEEVEVVVEVAKIADSYLAVPEPAVAPADSYLSSEPAPV